MRKNCERKGFYQEWPTKGKLNENMNLKRNDLTNKLKNKQGEMYAYVLTTIKNRNEKFIQTGCAPNFQGNRITLCTCKHYMRTWRDVSNWKEAWIVGFTGINVMEDRRNYLFYIMKVAKAFPSHKTIWYAESMSGAIRNAKNAQANPLGDIYRPKPDIKDEFNHSDYYKPIKNHVHNCSNNTWHNDIEYSVKGKRPALLVGDTNHSFLWSRPIIYFKNKHPRTKKWDMQDLISLLESK